jgi:TatD DNase family protein
LKGYSVKKRVHWYSGEEPPTDYLDQDCFFTIGPDAETNEAVRQVIALAPIDRLLTETDGMNAVSWAIGRKARAEELPDVLRASVRAVAGIRRMPDEEVARAIRRNYDALLK